MAKEYFFRHMGTGSSPSPYTVPANKHLVICPIYRGIVALNVNGVQAHQETSPEMKALVAPSGTALTLSGGDGRLSLSGFLYDNMAMKDAFLRNMGTGGTPDPYTVPEGKSLVAVPIYHGLVAININGDQVHASSSPSMKAFSLPAGTVITLSGSSGRVHLSGYLYDE